MAATHLEITVELVGGMHAHDLWPRPGRVLVAARRTTFSELAGAIDTAFARWDRAHLHLYTLVDGTTIAPLSLWHETLLGMVDGDRTSVNRLRPGEQFAYTFDMGDSWEHLCTVSKRRVDPVQELGIDPDQPLASSGWGGIPDQYGRRWAGDDGETATPSNPHCTDLPTLLPGWGPRE